VKAALLVVAVSVKSSVFLVKGNKKFCLRVILFCKKMVVAVVVSMSHLF
jgi:hypothetical protein